MINRIFYFRCVYDPFIFDRFNGVILVSTGSTLILSFYILKFVTFNLVGTAGC